MPCTFFWGLVETGLHFSVCNFQSFVVQRHTVPAVCCSIYCSLFSLFLPSFLTYSNVSFPMVLLFCSVGAMIKSFPTGLIWFDTCLFNLTVSEQIPQYVGKYQHQCCGLILLPSCAAFYLSKVSVNLGEIKMEFSVYAHFNGNQMHNGMGKWCFWSSDSDLKSRLKVNRNLS